jgi:hypothetical protein
MSKDLGASSECPVISNILQVMLGDLETLEWMFNDVGRLPVNIQEFPAFSR